MIKKMLAPVQAWLLARGQCVGCGMPLKKGTIEQRTDLSNKITCKCGRLFIQDQKTKKYRRALTHEI